jgi:hypothetical protein
VFLYSPLYFQLSDLLTLFCQRAYLQHATRVNKWQNLIAVSHGYLVPRTEGSSYCVLCLSPQHFLRLSPKYKLVQGLRKTRADDMQPLKNSKEIAVVEKGRQVLQLLHAHALKFPQQAQALDSAAGECEREVHLVMEVEQEMEQEVHHARMVARCETNWVDWEKALQSRSLDSFMKNMNWVAGIQVPFVEPGICYCLSEN